VGRKNLCFFSGVIISNPDFKFILNKNLNLKNSLHISICRFELKLENETIVTVKAYDELADFCYSSLKKGEVIAVSGRSNVLYEIENDFCQRLF